MWQKMVTKCMFLKKKRMKTPRFSIKKLSTYYVLRTAKNKL